MPVYAILGATGATGSELVKYLLPRTDVHLNVYARSASKLHALHPGISTAENVTRYIGPLSDTALITSCLHSAAVVFGCVAQNINEPGCSIAQRTAHVI